MPYARFLPGRNSTWGRRWGWPGWTGSNLGPFCEIFIWNVDVWIPNLGQIQICKFRPKTARPADLSHQPFQLGPEFGLNCREFQPLWGSLIRPTSAPCTAPTLHPPPFFVFKKCFMCFKYTIATPKTDWGTSLETRGTGEWTKLKHKTRYSTNAFKCCPFVHYPGPLYEFILSITPQMSLMSYWWTQYLWKDVFTKKLCFTKLWVCCF